MGDLTLPNLFLIGAPKCGTTSIADWLSTHPSVFMCQPKEPFFFCKDIRANRAATSWPDYVNLFSKAHPDQIIIGEASTSYLRSEVAISEILQCISSPKFIVCLRNPVTMVASVHAQMLKGTRENIADLEQAWDLQESRREGLNLPPRTKEPKDLIYAATCSLGTQLRNLYDQVDRSQVFLVFMDDLQQDPETVWTDIQTFLGVPLDGRTDFDALNTRALPRSILATKLLSIASNLKSKIVPRIQFGFGAKLAKLLERKPRKDELTFSASFERKLIDHFDPEIELIEKLTSRNLANWRQATK